MPAYDFTFDTPRLHIRPLVEADLTVVATILDAGFGAQPLAQRCDWLAWTLLGYSAQAALYSFPTANAP
jgi:hypothetical protein